MIQFLIDEDSPALPTEIQQQLETNLEILLKKLNNENRIISLYFCSASTIQELNNAYRGKDKATDILSWLYGDEFDEGFPAEEVWGELVICLEVCQDQAERTGWPLEVELNRLVVHGLAHLMGHDHENSPEEEKEMLKFEKELLSSIGLENLYP